MDEYCIYSSIQKSSYLCMIHGCQDEESEAHSYYLLCTLLYNQILLLASSM